MNTSGDKWWKGAKSAEVARVKSDIGKELRGEVVKWDGGVEACSCQDTYLFSSSKSQFEKRIKYKRLVLIVPQ